jgi:hypothetical protein
MPPDGGRRGHAAVAARRAIAARADPVAIAPATRTAYYDRRRPLVYPMAPWVHETKGGQGECGC